MGNTKKRQAYDEELDAFLAAAVGAVPAKKKLPGWIQATIGGGILLCFLSFLLFRNLFPTTNTPQQLKSNDGSAVTSDPVISEDRAVSALAGLRINGTFVLAEELRTRPSSAGRNYVHLDSDEYYEIFFDLGATMVSSDDRYVSVWTKHVKIQEGQTLARRLNQTPPSSEGIGFYLMQTIYDLKENDRGMLSIHYFGKDGGQIATASAPDENIEWQRAYNNERERLAYVWLKRAVKATERRKPGRERALEIGRLVVMYRGQKMERDFVAAKDKIVTYTVKKGGTIKSTAAFVRNVPLLDAPMSTQRLPKGTPMFVTKSYKDQAGTLWYFIEHVAAQGWIPEKAVTVY